MDDVARPKSSGDRGFERDRIAHLEGSTGRKAVVLPFGVAEIDARLPGGGLAFGALHEVAGGGAGTVDGAAAALFGLTTRKCISRTLGENLWRTRVSDIMRPGAMKACATGGAGRDWGGFQHSSDSRR